MATRLEEFSSAIEVAGLLLPQPLLVCADWCDENHEAELAYALKWCAGKGYRPFKRHDGEPEATR